MVTYAYFGLLNAMVQIASGVHCRQVREFFHTEDPAACGAAAKKESLGIQSVQRGTPKAPVALGERWMGSIAAKLSDGGSGDW
jgi:hypothetical protein